MSKATPSSVSFTSLAAAIGQMLGDLKAVETKAAAFKEAINANIAKLHEGKVTVGTYKKDGTGCAIATAFIDGGVAAGLSQSTMQKTYLPTFKQAVATGKPVTDWNGQRAKKGGKGKGGKASEPKTLANKLATCYRDEDFAGFIADLQASYDDAEVDNLIDGIKSYLEAAGIELKDAE
jgi:hypothetical protein